MDTAHFLPGATGQPLNFDADLNDLFVISVCSCDVNTNVYTCM